MLSLARGQHAFALHGMSCHSSHESCTGPPTLCLRLLRTQWLGTERGVGVRYERMALRSLSHAAKFLYHSQSKVGGRAELGVRPAFWGPSLLVGPPSLLAIRQKL